MKIIMKEYTEIFKQDKIKKAKMRFNILNNQNRQIT